MPRTLLGPGVTTVNSQITIPALRELSRSEAWAVNPFYRCETKAQRGNRACSESPRGSGRARIRTLTSAKVQKVPLTAPNSWPPRASKIKVPQIPSLPGKVSEKQVSPAQSDGGGLALGITSIPPHCSVSVEWDRAEGEGTSGSHGTGPIGLLTSSNTSGPLPLWPHGCPLLPQVAVGLTPCSSIGHYQIPLLSEAIPDHLVYDSSPCFLPHPFSCCSTVLHAPYHHCKHWSLQVPTTLPTECKMSTREGQLSPAWSTVESPVPGAQQPLSTSLLTKWGRTESSDHQVWPPPSLGEGP